MLNREIGRVFWQLTQLNPSWIEWLDYLTQPWPETLGEAAYQRFQQLTEPPHIETLQAMNPTQTKFFWETLLLLSGLVDFPAPMEQYTHKLAQTLAYPTDTLFTQQTNLKTALVRENEPLPMWVYRVIRAYREFFLTGWTPFYGFYSLRRLHFDTNNRLSDLLGFLAQYFHPAPPSQYTALNWLGLEQNSATTFTQQLHQEGLAVLPQPLSTELCQAIVQFAQQTPCYPSIAGQESRDHAGKRLVDAVIFDPQHPVAHRYDFELTDLLQCEALQTLIAQPAWPELAQLYLGAIPALTVINLWWSAAFEGEASRYTGQVFHIDIDRFNYLCFFICLTEVLPTTGPHVFIKGSHRTKTLELAEDRRMSPADIHNHYSCADWITITGPAGTIWAEDSKGFHCGRPLQTGCRLMLQLEFSADRFGENWPQLPLAAKDPLLDGVRQANPYTWWNYPIATG